MIIRNKLNLILIVFVLLIFSNNSFSQVSWDQKRYVQIGTLQSRFLALGSERAWNHSYYEGLQWPADYSEQDKMKYEYEVLGFTCSRHPMYLLRSLDSFPSAIYLDRLNDHIGSEVAAAGIGLAARSCRTKKKETMGFLTIEDETATAEVTIPPAIYPSCRPVIYSRGPFLITGNVESRYGNLTIQAKSVQSLSD